MKCNGFIRGFEGEKRREKYCTLISVMLIISYFLSHVVYSSCCIIIIIANRKEHSSILEKWLELKDSERHKVYKKA